MTDQLRAGVIAGQGRDADELARAMGAQYGPTPEQKTIIESPAAPMLVVAGAGSGKTETLSMRIVYLLDHAEALFGTSISPDEILCLTFTRKAAAEIAERADERIHQVWDRMADGSVGPRDPERPAPSVSTYNAYASRLAAEHGLRVGVDPDSTVLTDAALWQLASRTVEEWTASVGSTAAPSTMIGDLPSFAQQLRDHAVTPAQLRTWVANAQAFMDDLPKKEDDSAPGKMTQTLRGEISKLATLNDLADMVEEFQERKRRGAFLDFADQVATAVELAQIDTVAQTERSRYRAVLLDEFQDTSPAQLQLFARMFGADHPVMAVGDPHQAIYGFRGASAQALADFVEQFGGDRVARASLTVSWRNEASVLHAANVASAPLRATSAIDVPALVSRSEYLAIDEPQRRAPGVESHMAHTLQDEAAHVVQFIRERRDQLGHGQWIDDDRGRPVQRNVTAAVLCRRRSSFGPIIEQLRSEGIDYEVVGLGGLLDTAEVADIVALLEVAHDPARGDALMRLLTSERINMGPRDLAALYEWAEELAGPRDNREGQPAIIDALADLPPTHWVSPTERTLTDTARTRLVSLQQIIAAIRRHTYLPVTELVTFVERAWLLDIETAVIAPDGRRRRNVDAFLDSARSFIQGTEHATLSAFLGWLDAAREHERGLDSPVKEPEPGAVQILTVHAAKGLEWDVVAVPGMLDGVFPSVTKSKATGGEYSDSAWLKGSSTLPWDLRMDHARLPQWDFRAATDHRSLSQTITDFKIAAGAHALEEDRRLFYVALTRARSHVLVAGAWFHHGVKARIPSVFMTELVDAGVVSDANWHPTPGPDDRAPEPHITPVPWPREPSTTALRRRELAAIVDRHREHAPATWDDPALPFAAEIAAMLAEQVPADRSTLALPAHLSTSAVVAMGRDRDEFAQQLRRPIPQEPTFAAQRGSELHAWIESQYGHTALLAAEDLGTDEHAVDDLAHLKQTFLESEWAPRVPSHIEVNVELPVAGLTIRSRIDAVFPAGRGLDRVTVVDWKSGRPPRDPHERAARELQLAVYRLAWAEWQGIALEDVDAVFYYVAAGETVRPERLLNRAQIEELVRRDHQ